MKRIRRRWTPAEVDLMFQMIADCQARGVRTEWRAIAKAVGHKASNCHVKFEVERSRRAEAGGLVTSADSLRRRKDTVPRTIRCADPDYTHSTSTAKLVNDAELRGRIAVLGITGGLLGDPAPGRSALDKMSPNYAERLR